MKKSKNNFPQLISKKLFVVAVSFWMMSAIASAQSISTVSTAYELGTSASGESKLHVFFSLEEIEQLAGVELLIGSTQGVGDVIVLTAQLVKREGKYLLIGPYGETIVEGNRAHLELPWSKVGSATAKHISLAAISTAQVKSAYAFGPINK